MKKILRNLIIEAISLWATDALMDSITFTDTSAIIMCAVALAFLNACVKPLLKLLALPVTVLTFGLFSLVINTGVLMMAFNMTDGASVASFGSAFIASIILTVVNSFVESVMKD